MMTTRRLLSFPHAPLALAGASLLVVGCGQEPAPDEPGAVVEQHAALSAGAPQSGSGILWHLPNGELHVWDMLDESNAKDLLIAGADRNVWTPVTTGDFNKDGAGDILWRSTANSLSGWLLTDTRQTGSTPETWNVPTAPFHTANVPMTAMAGDLNGDSVSDLVWNPISWVPTRTWMMASGSTSPTIAMDGPTDPALGIADFDNDAGHKADILRRRGSDGMMTIEYNNLGTTTTLEIVGFDWSVAGVGDFDGNKTADILWYHAASGTVHIWYMGTPNRQTPGYVGLDSGWSILGVGDFDKDGIADILWKHSSGVVGVWKMAANGTVSRYGSSLTIPSGANFAGIISLGLPTAPTNIATLKQLVNGSGQTIAPVQFNVATQRTTDKVEIWEVVGTNPPAWKSTVQAANIGSGGRQQLDLNVASFTNKNKACLQLKAWEQGRASVFTPKFCLAPTPDPKLDFTMQARFGFDKQNDKAIDLKPADDSIAAMKNNRWPVTLNTCASNDPIGGSSITNHKWAVGPTGGAQEVLKDNSACTAAVTLPGGLNNITVTVTTADGRKGSAAFTVNVKNTFIVVMGDSMMSGEANPLELRFPEGFPGQFRPAFWGSAEDAAEVCHRTASSMSARAALALERQDPRSSVTYLNVSCTGARIQNITGAVAQKITETISMPPQHKQLRTALCGTETCTLPKIDAIIFDGGINDLGFAGLLDACVLMDLIADTNPDKLLQRPPRCFESADVVNGQEKLLDDLKKDTLTPFGKAIKDLSPTAKIFTGEYPDPTSNAKGALCDDFRFEDALDFGVYFEDGHWSAGDIQWMHGYVGRFNAGLKTAMTASSLAFKFVEYTPAFVTHGYCSGSHWFQHYGESMGHQGNKYGTMHPDDFGHVAMAERLLPAMAEEGVGDANTVKFLPKQTFVRPLDSTSRYDWGTQLALTTRAPESIITETIHVCPDGYAMVGLYGSSLRELIKCQKIMVPTTGKKFLDGGRTQRTLGGTTMHACPVGSVMIGFHGSNNHFGCQEVTVPSGSTEGPNPVSGASPTQDIESKNPSMHVCTPGTVMTGVHGDQNKFGCRTGIVAN